jgi:hypothetical protein
MGQDISPTKVLTKTLGMTVTWGKFDLCQFLSYLILI